jgi:hypothetical protein
VTWALRDVEVEPRVAGWRGESVADALGVVEEPAEGLEADEFAALVEPFVAATVDVVPESLAAATAPKPTTAARLARAVPTVNARSRSTARLRSLGVSRCARVMRGVSRANSFGTVTGSARIP